MNSLVLGTAQLGLHYGIANKTGQPDQTAATAIVREAWEGGIHEFDTAQGYGISELVLGKALSKLSLSEKVRVISKLDPDVEHLSRTDMSDALEQSLTTLGVPYLSGLMLHREHLLSHWDKGLAEILSDFVSSGRVKHIGVAVYSPDKAIKALKTNGIDMVQLPTNVLDRRFEKEGVFQLADKKKKKIYIRSVFLQGLILMDIKEIPEGMAFAMPVLKKLESISVDSGLSRQEIALGYIKAEMPNSKVVFGADTPEHVKENLACWERTTPSSLTSEVKKHFDDVDEKILNPSLWPN